MSKTKYKWNIIHISLIIPIVLTVSLFVLSFFFFVIPTCKKIKIDGKKEMISELTYSVWSMLNKYENDVRKGLISLTEAQNEAILKIKYLRYGKDQKDYFWINDESPKMIMHPYNSLLDGKPLDKLKDPNGKNIFLESLNIVKTKGEGFIDYYWQWKDDSIRIVPKLSFVKEFKPWGWIIGTGVYINDVNDEIHGIQRKLIKISLVIITTVILLLISILLNSLRVEKKKKVIEKELDETRKNYKILIDNAPDAIVVYDIDLNRFVDVNPMAEKLFGSSNTDLLNTDPRCFFSSSLPENQFAEEIKALFKKAIKGEHPVFDMIVQNFSERKLCCEIRLVRLPNKNHRLIRASFNDITLRKQAEETIKANEALLKSLNEDKDHFFSILAHDLRSPFSAIISLTELLKKNVRDYDIRQIENFIHHINVSARSTFNLLEDLLMWARSQSGKLSFKPQLLNFTEVCQDIVSDMKVSAETKNITINILVTEKIDVYADIDMLKTILRNLISNAIKFTNNGGHVDVFVRQLNSRITISISDNGIGIPQQSLNKLFDITQKHTTTGTANETGTGLGLLLCKEFVEKHGGEIWVESKNGSDFKFTLPTISNYDSH